MGKRPRIKKQMIGEVVIDELAYVENKSSKNARKLLNKSEHIEIEIWCDKHYYSRAQLGDKKGKREGIEENKIKNLITKSVQHLLYYSFRVKNFIFINFDLATRYIRTVIQENMDHGMLNIVTEFHHLEHHKYQVTIITAMTNDDFNISLGQYVIEIIGNTSVLKKCEQNKLIEVSTYI